MCSKYENLNLEVIFSIKNKKIAYFAVLIEQEAYLKTFFILK